MTFLQEKIFNLKRIKKEGSKEAEKIVKKAIKRVKRKQREEPLKQAGRGDLDSSEKKE